MIFFSLNPMNPIGIMSSSGSGIMSLTFFIFDESSQRICDENLNDITYI